MPWEHARLRLDLGGEALVTLAYADGTEMAYGSDPEHRELVLRREAFAVHAEAVARLPFGMPNRDARLAVARVVRVDVALEALVRRLALVLEAGRALGPDHDAVAPLTDAAARALARARLAERDAAVRRARRRHRGPAERLGAAGRARPAPAGARRRRARLRRRRGRPPRPRAANASRAEHPPAGALALSAHAHLDLAWRWPLAETRRKARRTLWTAVGLLERHPDLHFNQSSAQVYAWLEEDDPALLARIEALGRRRPLRADRRHVGRAGLRDAGRRVAGPPAALRPALLRAPVRRPAHGLLAARLLRLLPGPAAAAARRGHRALLHDQALLVGDQPLPARPVLVGGARRQPRPRAHVRQPRRRLQRGRRPARRATRPGVGSAARTRRAC